jgi:hypothetical protein
MRAALAAALLVLGGAAAPTAAAQSALGVGVAFEMPAVCAGGWRPEGAASGAAIVVACLGPAGYAVDLRNLRDSALSLELEGRRISVPPGEARRVLTRARAGLGATPVRARFADGEAVRAGDLDVAVRPR